MSIAGTDFRPIAQEMLTKAKRQPNDANLWMNLATAMLSLGQRDIGLTIKTQALSLNRTFHLPAAEQPAKLRLLILMAAGDLAANTPIDCLLENCDIDLIFHFVSLDTLLNSPTPEHDALMVGISESSENHELIIALSQELGDWPKPIINAARHIPNTRREIACELLQDAPGLMIPPTLNAARTTLQAIADGSLNIADAFKGIDFPIIIRPIDSHAGRDLDKINGIPQLTDYLTRVAEQEFFLSQFIDYSGKDGLFRKFRIALVGGQPFLCHMAVSSHWMVHYVNAGMYEDADKRAEEALAMANFDAFALHHQAALDAIYRRTQLDYLCIDCAETADGQLFVFEVDHAMVVHAMDSEEMFPHKQLYMLKVKDAFRDFVINLVADQAAKLPVQNYPAR